MALTNVGVLRRRDGRCRLVGAYLFWLIGDGGEDGQEGLKGIANLIGLKRALTFGAVPTVVLQAVQYLKTRIGTSGVSAAAALSGLADVDTLTISVSDLVGDDLTAANSAIAIFIAASVNMAVKAGISIASGRKSLGLRVGPVYVAVIGAGAVSPRFLGWGGWSCW